MKRNLLLPALFLVITNFALAQITQTYRFDAPQFLEKENGYVEPVMNKCLNLGDEGYPLLPHFSAEILMPQGNRLKNIRVVSVKYAEKINDISIVPASRPFPISEPAPEGYFPQAEKSVYESANAFPEKITGTYTTQHLGGYAVGVFSIVPVQFFPQEKAVRYIEEITVEAETEPDPEISVPVAGFSEKNLQRVQSIVDNPEAASQYHFNEIKNSESVDLLLITKADFLNAFAGYVDYKTKRGFIVETMTTEDIYANYPGTDEQEKTRNCIIDYYENHGLQYVILGGDGDGNDPAGNIIPARGFYLDTGFGTVDNNLTSDMYYACLDGNWDNDGDGKYGEPGEEDLFAEIAIGRVAADSEDEIANMVSKFIKYQDTPVAEDVEKALMIGESLDATTYGGTYKDEVVEGSSSNGYTTAGLHDNIAVTRLYDMEGFWNKNDIFHEFSNHGCHLLNHLGHSNVTYNMKLNNSDLTVANLSNDGINRGLVIGYSQGCYNGAFDNRNSNFTYQSDCFAEVISALPTAEVASIGNTRYGWYSQNSTNGASQYFDRQFFDAIFGEDITEIGPANGDSKEDNAAYIMENQVIRWCAYELTVFGDPSMDIWTAQPDEIAATFPMAIQIGSGEMEISTDAPYARVGMMQDEELIGRAVADANGDVTLEFFDPLSINEPIYMTISAHNKLAFTETIAVLTDQAYVMYDSLNINDQSGNNNGMAEYGETLLLGLNLVNVGNQPAQDVTVTLSTTDTCISLPYLAVEFGDFEPGGEKYIADAFEVIIADHITDQHEIDVDVHAMGDSDEWISDFEIEVNAPVLLYNGYTLAEQSGNGNDLPDPGETLSVTTELSNTGHAVSPEIEAVLISANSHVDITSGTASLGALAQDETGTVTFEFVVSGSAAMGDLAELQLIVTAGAYMLEKTITPQIGMPVEDFETGDLSSFNWENGGDQPWEICTEDPYHGNYCLRSGNIGHSQVSEIKTTILCASLDTISFWFKTSSEEGYDQLNFYTDLIKAGHWSGTNGWQKTSYVIYPGVHTFKWVYEKDENTAQGDDCVWIDFVEFPMLMEMGIDAGENGTICQGDVFSIPATGSFISNIAWETSGDGTFSNSSVISPDYTPGPEDIAAGSVTLSVSATDITGAMLSDETLLTILGLPGTPGQPEGETEVCTNMGYTYDYTTRTVNHAVAYTWEMNPADIGTLTATDTMATIFLSTDYEGILELKVQALNDCGESEFSETLSIEGMICSSIGEQSRQQLTVTPNPGGGIFTIEIPATEQNLHMQVFQSDGRLVAQNDINGHSGHIRLDLTGCNSGVYYLLICGENRSWTEKVILK